MGRLRSALLMLLTSVWLVTAAHAFPVDQCPADRFGADLGCTAGDVSITGMRVVGDTTSCVGGTDVTLDLELTVNFAVPDRWDVGIFISSDGKDPGTLSANGGAASCSVSVLPNSNPFLDLDGPTDTCGDGNKDIGGGTGSGIHYMPSVTVPCQSLGGAGGNLYIPFVVSWDNQKTPPGAICTSNADPVPNTKSKCNSPTIAQGSVSVVVLPAITKTDNKTTLFSGDSTSYLVTITNTTGALLIGAVFKDPAVSGITANSVSCAAAGGAICPLISTVGAMQGTGIILPLIPDGGSLTFTIDATLTGSPGDDLTNTASVTVGSQSNSASDTNTIVDTIAILPVSQSKSSDKGATVRYTYTLYNFGTVADTITLAAVSSMGWTVAPSPTTVTIAAGGSATVTLDVQVPGGATVGEVDTTTITATSGINPGKTATATAVTSVTEVLTLTPSNTGAGGAGASVYYTHRVQSNASASKSVSLTPSFTSGTCSGWSSALFETDKTTALTSPVTLAANGGYRDFVLKLTIPTTATALDTCTATLTAAYTSGAASSVSVTDETTVKNLLLYNDPGYTVENYVYPTGNSVYAKGFGLSSTTAYEYRWYDANGTEVCTPRLPSTSGTTFPDTCLIPGTGPLGTWVVQIWDTTSDALFVQREFYVGPDHLQASYSGASPAINTDTVIDLALHDRDHNVPVDSSGNLVKGGTTDPEDPLMISVTVDGSATIVSTTLSNAVITGQSVTGRLDSTSGTATLTIRDIVAETVTITPASYRGVLYGSPARDESASVTFTPPPLDHYQIESSGVGVTCTPSTLTIKACADSTCSSLYTSGASGTLTATGAPTVNWVGGATFTIPSGDGSVTKEVQVTTPGDVLFGMQSGSLNPAPAGSSPTCNFGTPSCTFTAYDSGLLFDVPNHAAETVQTVTVTAVKKADNSLACVPAFANQSNVPVTFQCNYLNPGSGSYPLRMGVGNTGTALAADASSPCSAGGASLNLNFDASGVAQNIQVIYADVGEMGLTATYSGSVGSAGLTMIGVDTFVSKPASFALTIPGNPAATTASGGAFKKAGEVFPVTVEARNSVGAITPNYGKETAAESVMLTQTLVAPLDCDANPANDPDCHNPALNGSFGAFAMDCSGNATTAGTACGMFSWAEVGILKLTPSVADGEYLGAGDITVTAADFVGRFVADHFDLVLFPAAFSPSATTFTYLGQDFVYATAPDLTITARGLGGELLSNYERDFWKLGTSITTAGTNNFQYADNAGAGAVLQSPTADIAFGDTSNVDGVATISAIHAGASFRYQRPAAPIAPFDGDISLTVTVLDSDGASGAAALANIGFSNDSDTGPFDTTADATMRFGRAVLSDTYGSSASGSTLALPLTLQYFNGTDFIDNSDDVDSIFNSSLLGCTDPVADSLGCADISVNAADVANGESYTLNASGSRGTLLYSLDLSTIAPYLQYDWSGTGTLSNPSASATFGIYRGDDRFLYWREVE